MKLENGCRKIRWSWARTQDTQAKGDILSLNDNQLDLCALTATILFFFSSVLLTVFIVILTFSTFLVPLLSTFFARFTCPAQLPTLHVCERGEGRRPPPLKAVLRSCRTSCRGPVLGEWESGGGWREGEEGEEVRGEKFF